MWSRLGTPTQRAASGTVKEFQRAYQRAKRTDFKSPRMMVYFKTAPPAIRMSADASQHQAVLEFEESLSDGLLTWDFDNTDHFRDLGIPLDLDVPRPTCDAVVDTLRPRWKAFRESHPEAGATPCGIVNSLGSRMTGARLLMALLQDSAAEVRLRAAGLELAGGDHRVAPFDELRRAQGRGSP